METSNVLPELRKKTGSDVVGRLHDGRWYLKASKYYAWLPPLNTVAWEKSSIPEAPTSTNYKQFHISIQIEVDYYIMRDEFDVVVKEIRSKLDDEYYRTLKEQGLT